MATAALLVFLLLPAMIFMNLYAPRLRPLFEFIAALPFVVPAIALVAGLTALFTGPEWLIGTPFYLVIPYFFLALPYAYRALDVGIRALDLATITEAAQSLGADMWQIIRLVVLPNLRPALVGSLLLTLAVVIGEFTFANVLLFRTYGVFINEVGQHEATEGAALSVLSFLITWGSMLGVLVIGRGAGPSGRSEIAMATVQADDVSKSYGGREVLARLNLEMSDGELICLLGPSGCGKTTLLRIVAGFVTPDTGRVLVSGRDVTSLPASARRMGMVFQAYSLFPNMTALDNVRFGPRVAGRPRTEQLSRAAHLLDLVGLSAHSAKFPHQLSGGQQQRVALARALAVQPEVLLLDEPLSALDAKVRVQLREEIRRIQRETGVTTILVTHDQEEALSISDRVAVMNGGRLLQVAAPAVIYREPADGFVARFIGVGGVLSGVAEGAAVRLANGAILPAGAASRHAAGQRIEMFLRPEHVRLAPMNGHVPLGSLAADVQETTFLGSLTRVRLSMPDMPGHAGLWADLPSEQADEFRPGRKVTASWHEAAPRVMASEPGEA